jgi:chorismate-pyruvate lyase
LIEASPESADDGMGPSRLTRRRYRDDLPSGTPLAAWAEAWLRVLLTHDGSATLLCETIARQRVSLEVSHQAIATEAPEVVAAHLGGRRFLERQVVLHHENEVMMDNLTYVALDLIDDDVAAHLAERRSPIGHIFEHKPTKKRPIALDCAILDRLWSRAGIPDAEAARSYVLNADRAACMLITECYRAGMRRGLPIRS